MTWHLPPPEHRFVEKHSGCNSPTTYLRMNVEVMTELTQRKEVYRRWKEEEAIWYCIMYMDYVLGTW